MQQRDICQKKNKYPVNIQENAYYTFSIQRNANQNHIISSPPKQSDYYQEDKKQKILNKNTE